MFVDILIVRAESVRPFINVRGVPDYIAQEGWSLPTPFLRQSAGHVFNIEIIRWNNSENVINIL